MTKDTSEILFLSEIDKEDFNSALELMLEGYQKDF